MADSGTSVQVTLFVSRSFLIKEKKMVVTVYCPELDLGGMGGSREEAEEQFKENLKMNLAVAKAEGFLEDVLQGFGWTQEDGHWSPPEMQMEKTTVTL